MRVVHVCLSNFFIDEHSYQENELVTAHARAGHDVMVLASTHVHGADGNYAFAEPGHYCTPEGVPVIRLPYRPPLPNQLGIRLRIHKDVYRILDEFGPDVILFHGISGWELLTVARYARDHPEVTFYADNHADFLTAGRTFVTRWGLHYMYYRLIAKRALPEIEKVLCISPMTLEYARDFFGIPEEKLELFPLGGWPLDDDELALQRIAAREEAGIDEDNILFVQSGKQYARKYLPEALRAFAAIDDPRFRLIITGVLMEDIRDEVEILVVADPRVKFIGWKTPDALRNLLCAADVYLQPGRQSATMQMSLCCGCAVILESLSSNTPYVNENGWLIDGPGELEQIFRSISADKVDLDAMRRNSIVFARATLDYAKLAQRVLDKPLPNRLPNKSNTPSC